MMLRNLQHAGRGLDNDNMSNIASEDLDDIIEQNKAKVESQIKENL